MILLTHILIALASLVSTAYAYASPSRAKLRASYGLMALTLTSGTYLVISTGAPLAQSCITGIVYVGVMSIAIIAARRRLAVEKTN